MLSGKGFKKVYNLSGGIQAWKGLIADGPVELNLDLVRGDETPHEIIRLAYGMEMSLGEFYSTMACSVEDAEVADLLNTLAAVEAKHRQYLVELYRSAVSQDLDLGRLEAEVSSEIMEGGISARDFIERNEPFLKTVQGLLDLAMMLESQALDLYLRFADKTTDSTAKEILFKIADEEKGHLSALGRLREDKTPC